MSIFKMRHDEHVYHPGLPKANWISVDLRGFRMSRPYFLKMRLANAIDFWFFGVNVVLRRPWLAGPARQLYPQLFKGDKDV